MMIADWFSSAKRTKGEAADLVKAMDDSEPLKVVCAWCGAYVRGDRGSTNIDNGGICRECHKKEIKKLEARKEKK